MTTIAEAYVHLRPYDLEGGKLDELGARAVLRAIEAFREAYKFDATLQVRLERGSAKVWVAVLTVSMPTLYNGIASWPDFKSGLHEAVQDARAFGDLFNPAFVEEANAEPQEVYHTERRTKTPGKLLRGAIGLENAKSDRARTEALNEIKDALRDVGANDAHQLRMLIEDVFPQAKSTENGTEGRLFSHDDAPNLLQVAEPFAQFSGEQWSSSFNVSLNTKDFSSEDFRRKVEAASAHNLLRLGQKKIN